MAERDWFERGFGAALTDIRQKLVEEMWFGRAVTPRQLASLGQSDGMRTLAERFGWDSQTQDQAKCRPGKGFDHDR